jgi:hypothetical protein
LWRLASLSCGPMREDSIEPHVQPVEPSSRQSGPARVCVVADAAAVCPCCMPATLTVCPNRPACSAVVRVVKNECPVLYGTACRCHSYPLAYSPTPQSPLWLKLPLLFPVPAASACSVVLACLRRRPAATPQQPPFASLSAYNCCKPMDEGSPAHVIRCQQQ